MAQIGRKPTAFPSGGQVVVAGGGPAGAFFAITLLRRAQKAGQDIRVTIIDWQGEGNRSIQKAESACGGVIWPNAHQRLAKNGIFLPEQLICQEIEHLWIHGCWKNFPFKAPAHQKLVTLHPQTPDVGNGAPPLDFQTFLLQTAHARGAVLQKGEVKTIRYGPDGKPVLTVRSASGSEWETPADFAVIATGVGDADGGPLHSGPLLRAFQRINPGFSPPKTRPVLRFDLPTGRDYLQKYMNRELHLILSGFRKPAMEEIALIPRWDRLTVAMTGKSIDRAASAADLRKTVREFLSLDEMQALLPHLAENNLEPVGLVLTRRPVRPARMPFADRIALIGDAIGTPDGRDGLESAFRTADALAQTLLENGLDRESLTRGYGPTVRWMASEQFYGRLLYGLLRPALRNPLSARVLYQAFATEMKFQPMDQWPLGRLLWGVDSQTIPCREACFALFRPPILRALLTGARKSARNILTERFFGIRWGTHGRYPTVILQEKRDAFKKTIEASLGIRLNPSPDMERMYAVKIRATAQEIFSALGTFGEVDGKMLQLRFVQVRRVAGAPNQVGSVVQYRLRRLPVTMDLRLIQAIPDQALLYDVQEVFANHGQLIFHIRPTGDGNHRLVVYTAFDFKRGETPAGRIFWRLFRWLFPEYAHDVVWNHTMCQIKGDVEATGQTGEYPPPGQIPKAR
jgi:2-polyprenyl-6-methoxyphenol hydroxylase-like FAD-dependent oxidoreductase